ncbi:MAG: tRNA pseudouridine(38-40) synthase TruA [Anaerolineae bacterium]
MVDPAVERRYGAVLEYDGTDFSGFQIQAEGRTVQGELETALRRVTQVETRVIGAGRTDAGVHASGQVIAFTVPWRHTTQDLQRALNAVLPADVALRTLRPVPGAFHPRFDAIRRTYHYTVLNQPERSPLGRRYACHTPQPLDVEAMRQAGQCLIGRHDFASFGRPPQGNKTVRHVTQAEWVAEGPRLTFVISANAFLYRMVRAIVGTLLQVGKGERAPAEMLAILEARERSLAGPLAPACGLCLVEVGYPEADFMSGSASPENSLRN